MRKLSFSRLKKLLDYDPTTGRLTWRSGQRARTIAGSVDDRGRRIRIKNKTYRAGPLIVLWMTGHRPPQSILVDHANGKIDDNRWSNLRLANRSQNAANSCPYKSKAVRLKGVSWHKEKKRYYASIMINYRKIHLGYFDRVNTAHAAYMKAARKYFGDFARAR